jgi:hypothetical protein
MCAVYQYKRETNCVKLVLSWQANSHSAREEITLILRGQKLHCHVHKSPLLAPTMSQINTMHAKNQSYFLNIHFNIILPSTHRSSKGSVGVDIKTPLLVPTMSQINPMHAKDQSYFLNIHFNIILPSTHRSSKAVLELVLKHIGC